MQDPQMDIEGQRQFSLHSAGVIPDRVDGRWWVAHTRPRAEKALSADLCRLAIMHYLPLRKRVSRSKATNRISRSVVPVFPGYLFFVATESQRYQAMTTNRIANTLTVPDQEQLVAQLCHIQTVLGSDATFTRHSSVRVGRWVRILAGPLAGVEGVVSGWRSSVRVTVNVSILGQSVSVETEADMVQLIDPPA
jgi:transcription antitermination factor NusG